MVTEGLGAIVLTGGGYAQFGPNSSFPHGSSVPQVAGEGTMILVDGGCSVEG